MDFGALVGVNYDILSCDLYDYLRKLFICVSMRFSFFN